ncbi:hypothetical protein RIF29_39235 [Crotalaria pallida]|uniref:Uncharacterized protein n=1 Tax=Crotalaria pallida TaxID=3830 RepID=A0AAN9E0R2_CROPI
MYSYKPCLIASLKVILQQVALGLDEIHHDYHLRWIVVLQVSSTALKTAIIKRRKWGKILLVRLEKMSFGKRTE